MASESYHFEVPVSAAMSDSFKEIKHDHCPLFFNRGSSFHIQFLFLDIVLYGWRNKTGNIFSPSHPLPYLRG